MTLSINQIAVYLLVLVLGWLLGLLSRRGGGVWKERYQQEVALRTAREAEHDDREAASRARIAEMERHSPPIGVGTAGAVAAAASGSRDDLTLIRGIGRSDETGLNDEGIHRFVDLSRLSDHDAAMLEGRLGITAGTILRDEWREQAAMLASGRSDEHRARFS